ncbi:OsmC family protein [Membranicola marinus]|uniref:OsmC family protein n=1 Tax=Membranihabitans marinus TaxID=1227546 RepID=A0A953L9U9_9BACT|nr:OsmC family protein [Membranihabitans marinus]MBY5958018.1 OsmC family protein [Membranihabitans marinus]
MKRHATSIWKGKVKEGNGKLTSQSGTLENTPYSFAGRFTDEDGTSGTNPEELIAAAHAGCFNMALSKMLTEAGFDPEELKTKATVTIDAGDGGVKISKSHLELNAKIDGIDQDKFDELTGNAKKGCPVSAVLNCEITLDATLN